MSWLRDSGFFIFLIILGLCVLIFSIYDIIYDKGLMIVVIPVYAVILIISIVAILLKSQREEKISVDVVEEFEKTLKGGLYHFKCPTCSGIFAVKKSKSNNKNYVKMTCPDCGVVGVIPPNPNHIEEEIPEKKSIKANFRCNSCGEGITVWAEGTELYKRMNVFSCPFCGEAETMKRI